MINAIIAVIFIAGFFGYLIYGVYWVITTNKKDKLQAAAEKIENDAWLKEQMALPKYQVIFETDSGIKHSLACGPRFVGWVGYWKRYTSRDQAESVQQGFYQQGYFVDTNETTYPTCNVRNSRVGIVQ